jgi:hypothetical protein
MYVSLEGIRRKQAIIDAIQAVILAKVKLESTQAQIAAIDQAFMAKQEAVGLLQAGAQPSAKRTSIAAASDLGLGGEQHHTIQAIAQQWGMGVDLVRELFDREPDVMAIDRPETRNKRGYVTRYVPESAIRRVHAELVADQQKLIKMKPKRRATH